MVRVRFRFRFRIRVRVTKNDKVGVHSMDDMPCVGVRVRVRVTFRV